jgi:hypothetical protein
VIPSSAETGRSVYQIGVAVSDTKQAQAVIAFKSADEHGEPIDRSTVIEQFHIEHSLPEN